MTLLYFPGIRPISWHELRSDRGLNAFPPPLQPFHELPDQLFLVRVANMRRYGFAFKRVTHAHRNQDISCFVWECCCHLISLFLIVPRPEIIEDCVHVSSHFLFWQNFSRFLIFALLFLDNTAAGYSECSCAFRCCKKSISSSLVAADNFIPVGWKTPRTTVPVAAVVLEHSLCSRVIAVHYCPNNPPLTAVAA